MIPAKKIKKNGSKVSSQPLSVAEDDADSVDDSWNIP
jgi:hypothetical protein